jgi:hypothetical protein
MKFDFQRAFAFMHSPLKVHDTTALYIPHVLQFLLYLFVQRFGLPHIRQPEYWWVGRVSRGVGVFDIFRGKRSLLSGPVDYPEVRKDGLYGCIRHECEAEKGALSNRP